MRNDTTEVGAPDVSILESLPDLPAVLVTVKEAGRMLGVGRTTAYELIASGDLEVVHIGRCSRVPVESILALVEGLRKGNHESP